MINNSYIALYFIALCWAGFICFAGTLLYCNKHPAKFLQSPQILQKSVGNLRKFWFGDNFVVRIIFGTIACTGGVFVMLPFNTTTPPFVILSQTIPEFIWGATFFLVGLFQLIDAYRLQTGSRGEISAITGIFMWAYLFFVSVGATPNSIAALIYSLFSIVWCWIYWNAPNNSVIELIEWLQGCACHLFKIGCKDATNSSS